MQAQIEVTFFTVKKALDHKKIWMSPTQDACTPCDEKQHSLILNNENLKNVFCIAGTGKFQFMGH